MKLICRHRLECVVEWIGRSIVYMAQRGYHNDRELLNKRIEIGVDDVARINDTQEIDITGGEIFEWWPDGSVKAVRFYHPCTLTLSMGDWVLDGESVERMQNESLRRLFYDYISKSYQRHFITACAIETAGNSTAIGPGGPRKEQKKRRAVRKAGRR